MVDPDRVVSRIAATEAYLVDVETFRDAVDRQTFLDERGEQYRIAFPLQQAIQGCVDIAAHWVASDAGHAPETLAELFSALEERGLIDAKLAGHLSEMARFRNLLVHEYGRLDAARVWEMLHDRLTDIRAFLAAAARRLEGQ